MSSPSHHSTIQSFNHSRGFTLVETIVSLGILMLGVGASLTLVTATIAYSKQTESLIVITNLAREGLEVVRAIRDVQGFANLPGATPGDNSSWIIDRTTTTFDQSALSPDVPATNATFSGGVTIHECTNCTLSINNNQYLMTPGTATPFSRLITINTLSAEEKEVISTMRWTEHGRVHTYQLTTVLTNWK
jgi:type II secretory pathway pseudopilin PulG